MLAELGWRGICFEPHPDHFNKLAPNHANAGHKVNCVKLALSDFVGEKMFHFAGSISTISTSQIHAYKGVPGFPGAKAWKPVKISTLDLELYKRGWLPKMDFVSIDVEGEELAVLRGFDLPYWRPTMIVVETHEMHKSKAINWVARPIWTMLDFYGYRQVYADAINSIFVLSSGE